MPKVTGRTAAARARGVVLREGLRTAWRERDWWRAALWARTPLAFWAGRARLAGSAGLAGWPAAWAAGTPTGMVTATAASTRAARRMARRGSMVVGPLTPGEVGPGRGGRAARSPEADERWTPPQRAWRVGRTRTSLMETRGGWVMAERIAVAMSSDWSGSTPSNRFAAMARTSSVLWLSSSVATAPGSTIVTRMSLWRTSCRSASENAPTPNFVRL